eukprot:gene21783-27849_t
MLPDCQQPFVIHQFLEIANSMKDTGPAKNTAAFTGERFMGLLSKGVTHGGQKYTRSTTTQLVGKENAYRQNFKTYEDNKFPYIDNTDTFAEWVTVLHNAYNEDDFSAEKVKDFVGEVLYIEFGEAAAEPYLEEDQLERVLADVMANIVSQAKIYIADFDTIIRELAEFGTKNKQPIASHIAAMVKGVKLTGRGESFAEKSVAVRAVQGNAQAVRAIRIENDANILCENWHDRFQVNSWCRVQDFYIQTIAPKKGAVDQALVFVTKKKVYFGQINYMFRAYVPSDRILNGCAFANVMLRKPTMDKKRGHNYVGMNDDETYFGDKHFVSLNYVDSTAVALSALDENGYPVMNPNQVRKNMKFTPKDYKLKFSPNASEDLSRLYFIEMHKERLELAYDLIESDSNGTKVFEDKKKMNPFPTMHIDEHSYLKESNDLNSNVNPTVFQRFE